jgi:hypothetical protein
MRWPKRSTIPMEPRRPRPRRGLSNLGLAALPAIAPLSRAALHALASGTRSEALHGLKGIGPEGLPTTETAAHDRDTNVLALLTSYGHAGACVLASFLDEPWSDGSRRAISALDSLKRDALS